MQRKVTKHSIHIRHIIHDRSIVLDFSPDGATMLISDCYRFRKMPKALLIRNGKLRNLAYTFVTSFPTDLPS